MDRDNRNVYKAKIKQIGEKRSQRIAEKNQTDTGAKQDPKPDSFQIDSFLADIKANIIGCKGTCFL